MPKRSRLPKNATKPRSSRLAVDKPFFAKPVLTERDVNLLKNRLSQKRMHIDEVFDYIPEGGWRLTPEQTRKGLDWLMDRWKSPKTGAERKNNPFGYREQEVLRNFKEFRLVDFYDMANAYQVQAGIHWYLPVYEVIAKDGSSFQYHIDNTAGGVRLIG